MATQNEQLAEIARGIRLLNKAICCQTTGGGGGGTGTFDGHIISSCGDPVHTSLCEFPALITKLNEIKTGIDGISITADAINLNADQIDLNVTDLETLVTASNGLLSNIYTQVQRGASCGGPQYVNVCNQLDLTSMQNLLGNILTQVTAINANTDQLETLVANTNTALSTLTAINTVLTNIKADTASLVTNTAATNTALGTANTTLTSIKNYTKVLDDLRATYQPIDCGGLPVGVPIDVLPVVVANPIDTSLCNVGALAQAIADAIVFPTANQYNTVTQQDITSGVTTIAANTVHSISYIVLQGTCTITINGVSSVYAAGESSEEEGSGLINVPYVFTPGTSSRVRIKTIKP